jgi:type I restriction enzyme S subunit
MSWPLVELGDVCSKVSVGHVGKTSEYYTDNNGVPFLRTQNVSKSGIDLSDIKYVTDDFHTKLKKSQLLEGDVILSRVVSSQINCAVVPENFGEANCANIILARPEKDQLDSQFLFHYLKSELTQKGLLKRQVGSAQSVVNTSVFKSWQIPLPPLAEQKRIAAILDRADAIRQKRKQAIEMADEFLRSVFLDMFGDPVTNPKGWEIKSISDFCLVSSGATPSRKVEEYYQGNIPWVKTTEVDGYTILKTGETISQSALEKTSCKLNSKGSIVLAMYGQGKTRGKVGMLGVDAATNQACAVLAPSEKINMLFLYTYLKLSYETLRALGQGGGQPNLNGQIVKNFPVCIPPRNLQDDFVRRADNISTLRSRIFGSITVVDDLFDSLSQKAFAGEL